MHVVEGAQCQKCTVHVLLLHGVDRSGVSKVHGVEGILSQRCHVQLMTAGGAKRVTCHVFHTPHHKIHPPLAGMCGPCDIDTVRPQQTKLPRACNICLALNLVLRLQAAVRHLPSTSLLSGTVSTQPAVNWWAAAPTGATQQAQCAT